MVVMRLSRENRMESLIAAPQTSRSYAAKRLIDVLIAALGLTVGAPLFLLLATAVFFDSGRPILFKSQRVGRYGTLFILYKFTTMTSSAADVNAPSSTAADDPRITRVGRILRCSKLDELPQLINVLRGEMSLVGPRPQVPWIAERFSETDKVTLLVRPGLTNLAFVQLPDLANFLRGSDDPDRDYLRFIHPLKMQINVDYVRRCSFWLDVRILIDTVLVTLVGRSLFFGRLTADDVRGGGEGDG